MKIKEFAEKMFDIKLYDWQIKIIEKYNDIQNT